MQQYTHAALVLIAFLFTLAACEQDKASDDEENDEPPAAEEVDEEEQAAESDDQEELEMVDVSDEGDVFEPPVEKEQIPEGAWFCDMGTVHYAQMEEGDGTCPECHMKLTQKGADEAPEGHADHDDHEGHDH